MANHLNLSSLPVEIQLRIVDFLHTASLPSVVRASKHWHALINDPDQDQRVYYDRAIHPPGVQDLSFLEQETTCFTRYYTRCPRINSWRDLCRHQALLGRSWSRDAPTVRTSVIAPRRANAGAPFGTDAGFDYPRIPVWRFRPDFQRRFVIATTQHGGLLVTDMDTGALLWSRRRDEVRGYAHLEYSNGWMAFDRFGNYIEIWKHVNDGSDRSRGTFEKVADLSHDVETRGFMMLWPTLCVVSTEQQGFVYDLSAPNGPRLTKRMEIASGTVGHLTQDDKDTVAFCIGNDGYTFHSKSTGKLQGTLNPRKFMPKGTYHVSHRHIDTPRSSVLSKTEPLPAPFPPRRPIASHKPQAQPLAPGVNLVSSARIQGEDEWGAGLIDGDLFVAISKGGRCMICFDWPAAIRSLEEAHLRTYIIEMEIDSATFDFGGWLSIKRGPPGPTRIICEVDDKIYIFRLPHDFNPLHLDGRILPDFMSVISIPSTCTPTNVEVPVSFMGVYDDCIMHTCLMGVLAREQNAREPYIAKAIRVVSFAPILDEADGVSSCPEEDDVWEDVDLRKFAH